MQYSIYSSLFIVVLLCINLFLSMKLALKSNRSFKDALYALTIVEIPMQHLYLKVILDFNYVYFILL